MTSFALEYAFFVFLATLGVLQFVFARNHLYALLFFYKSPSISAILGIALIICSFIWFFAVEPRNISDTAGGLDGNIQGRWFTLATSAGILTTLIISSAINHFWAYRHQDDSEGLDALKHVTFARSIIRKLRNPDKGIQPWK